MLCLWHPEQNKKWLNLAKCRWCIKWAVPAVHKSLGLYSEEDLCTHNVYETGTKCKSCPIASRAGWPASKIPDCFSQLLKALFFQGNLVLCLFKGKFYPSYFLLCSVHTWCMDLQMRKSSPEQQWSPPVGNGAGRGEFSRQIMLFMKSVSSCLLGEQGSSCQSAHLRIWCPKWTKSVPLLQDAPASL